jgi:signal transduction histidine kinase
MGERTAPAAATAALALFAAVGAAQTQRSAWLAATLAALAVVVCALLAARPLPGWVVVGVLAVPTAAFTALCHGTSSNVGWFGLCVLVGWATFATGTPGALVAGVAVVAVFVGEWLAPNDESGWAPWLAGTAFTAVACAFARRQRTLVDQLHAAQAGLAERARAEERNRMAAEMHDVIGHALTVSLLHVSSARLALDDDPDEARASLTEAERLARQSLEEVRATVGLMRAGPAGSDPPAPMPSGADVPTLVESFRRAGTPVTLEVSGDLGALGATRGLALYRIVQESLTNAARHGDGSPVVVRVEAADGGATVRVRSGTTGGPVRAGDGAGLLGMRERAEAVGGRLTAGPAASGWEVEAVLPS